MGSGREREEGGSGVSTENGLRVRPSRKGKPLVLWGSPSSSTVLGSQENAGERKADRDRAQLRPGPCVAAGRAAGPAAGEFCHRPPWEGQEGARRAPAPSPASPGAASGADSQARVPASPLARCVVSASVSPPIKHG